MIGLFSIEAGVEPLPQHAEQVSRINFPLLPVGVPWLAGFTNGKGTADKGLLPKSVKRNFGQVALSLGQRRINSANVIFFVLTPVIPTVYRG